MAFLDELKQHLIGAEHAIGIGNAPGTHGAVYGNVQQAIRSAQSPTLKDRVASLAGPLVGTPQGRAAVQYAARTVDPQGIGLLTHAIQPPAIRAQQAKDFNYQKAALNVAGQLSGGFERPNTLHLPSSDFVAASSKAETNAVARDMALKRSKLPPRDTAPLSPTPLDRAQQLPPEVMAHQASPSAKPGLPSPPKVSLPAKIQQSYNSLMAPGKNLSPETLGPYQHWVGERLAATHEGVQAGMAIKKSLPPTAVADPMHYIHQLQTGQATDPAGLLARKYYDEAHFREHQVGLPTAYVDNYVNQVWKETPAQMELKAKGLGVHPSFLQEKRIPTYAEGIQLGLTPKFHSLPELVADRITKSRQAVANIGFYQHLLETGKILPAKEAPLDWKPVDAPYFPQAAGDFYKAAPEVSQVIRNVFNAPETTGLPAVLHTTGRIAQQAQDIALAGGAPGTPANFFTFGQMIRDITAGRPQVVNEFLRSFSGKATENHYLNEGPMVTELAKRGVNLSFSNPLTPSHGTVWEKAFTKPTFERFMPNMYLRTATDVFGTATKHGLPPPAAYDLAANTLKNFYGIEHQLLSARPKEIQDFLSTFFFAPKYREGITTFLGQTGKSVLPKNLTNPSYSLNRRYLLGLGVTLYAFNELNKRLNGHGLKDNPPGRELYLSIPTHGDTIFYVPIGPSVLSLPRNLIGGALALGKGDLKAAGQAGASFLSTPLQVGGQVLNNTNYFGQPIYNDGSNHTVPDTGKDKAVKLARYVGQASNPFVGAAINLTAPPGKRQSNLQIGLATAEAPIKIGSKDKLAANAIYTTEAGRKLDVASSHKAIDQMIAKAITARDSDLLLKAQQADPKGFKRSLTTVVNQNKKQGLSAQDKAIMTLPKKEQQKLNLTPQSQPLTAQAGAAAGDSGQFDQLLTSLTAKKKKASTGAITVTPKTGNPVKGLTTVKPRASRVLRGRKPKIYKAKTMKLAPAKTVSLKGAIHGAYTPRITPLRKAPRQLRHARLRSRRFV